MLKQEAEDGQTRLADPAFRADVLRGRSHRHQLETIHA